MAKYEVEKILDKRGKGKRLEYLIKWKGYGEEENSWETVKNCHCKYLVRQFEDNLKQESRKPYLKKSTKEASTPSATSETQTSSNLSFPASPNITISTIQSTSQEPQPLENNRLQIPPIQVAENHHTSEFPILCLAKPPLIKPSPQQEPGVRRSSRTRVSTLRRDLGQLPQYEIDENGFQTLVGVTDVEIKSKRARRYMVIDSQEQNEMERQWQKDQKTYRDFLDLCDRFGVPFFS